MQLIFLGLILLASQTYAVPVTTRATVNATLSPQAAIHKLQEIIAKEVEQLWHNADHNQDQKFTRDDMNVIFTDYDHDHNGEIAKAEFITQFTHNEPDLNTIARGLFLEFDVDRNDQISHADLDKYFMRIDLNHNGEVSHAEFKEYFTKVLTLLFIVQLQEIGNTPNPAVG